MDEHDWIGYNVLEFCFSLLLEILDIEIKGRERSLQGERKVCHIENQVMSFAMFDLQRIDGHLFVNKKWQMYLALIGF